MERFIQFVRGAIKLYDLREEHPTMFESTKMAKNFRGLLRSNQRKILEMANELKELEETIKAAQRILNI